MNNQNSIIKSIDEQGNITNHASYSLPADRALVCYLEQTINNRYDTWNYWQDFIDIAGNEHKTKSKFIDMIKPLASGKGYGIDLGDKVICAYEQ
jgi:disulfide oxidoreductase YuzD